MILTDAERQRFIEYLTQNIESEKLLIPQLEKFPPLQEKMRMEMAAKMIVIKDLQSFEKMTITK